MERKEAAKKFFSRAQKMTIGLAVSVVAYGAIGYYLIQIGQAGSVTLNAQTYLFLKYGALGVSIVGIFAVLRLNSRILGVSEAVIPAAKRSVQKLFVRTVTLSAAAELPVLLGMILVFLGRQPHDYIPFAVISLAGFAFAYPKKEQWVSWLGADF